MDVTLFSTPRMYLCSAVAVENLFWIFALLLAPQGLFGGQTDVASPFCLGAC